MSRTVQKWGNSLGVRLPKELADQLNIDEGSEVELQVRDDHLVMRPITEKYDLNELVEEINEENRHAEQSAGSRGHEAW